MRLTEKIGILLLVVLGLVFIRPSEAAAEEDGPIVWWALNEAEAGATPDTPSGIRDMIKGRFTQVEGIEGKAVRFDGFTTVIVREPEKAPALYDDFTLEAWVALAAYPWNWVPVAAQEENEEAGYYFGIGPGGETGLHLAVDGKWTSCLSDKPISLRTWTHIAAVFDSGQGITLYIDGEKAGTQQIQGKMTPALAQALLVGMNREKRMPSHPVRTFGTRPAWFSLDGILDEIKIFNRALSAEEISNAAASVKPEAEPDIPERVMPSGPAGPGNFGAYYTHLQYYPEWDALQRSGPYSDIVVQFDDSPIRVVFWRGTRYSPVWVMENGIWMADQSAESFTGEEGCFEHMLDPHCRYSHVRIIENTDARVVVHWRYIPVSVYQNFSQQHEITGWADTIDEYYTFYPDGTGIRHVVMHTTGKPLGPQEVIVLCQPGTKPEDNIHLDALTLVNLEGDSHLYSWGEGMPDFSKEQKPENPVIQHVNLKSENKPFLIFEPGCRMRVFNIEQREEVSHFPWWNHWPAAQIPSDGRYCQAPDRASHFSLAWGGPPAHEGPGDMYWSAWIYGTTKEAAENLVPLARSWSQAPEMTAESQGIEVKGYDLTQRAYEVVCDEPGIGCELSVDAGPESPLHNMCIVLKGWGDKSAAVRLNGESAQDSVRTGFIRHLSGTDMIVWVELESDQPVKLELAPRDSNN